jgi:hypothetical protein
MNVLSAADGVLAARFSSVSDLVPMTAVTNPACTRAPAPDHAPDHPNPLRGSGLRECPRVVATRATALGQRN